jgi:hypothetical protein
METGCEGDRQIGSEIGRQSGSQAVRQSDSQTVRQSGLHRKTYHVIINSVALYASVFVTVGHFY